MLFGHGDDGYPFWLLTVRVNILVLVASAAVLIMSALRPARVRPMLSGRLDLGVAAAFTTVAAALRWFVVQHNVADLGGISYSRILLGYNGHFGAAQLYSLVYARGSRSMEQAIVLNRLAATLTVPLLYALCRRVAPARRAFAVCATALLSLHPLHLLFSATDALPIVSILLAVGSYWCLARAVGSENDRVSPRTVAALTGAAGLALVTQVRYENALFLAPPLLYFFAVRPSIPYRPLGPAGALLGLLLAIYAASAVSAESSYQNPIHWADGLRASARDVFVNQIFAIGPVLVGTMAALLDRHTPVRWAMALPLVVALPVITMGGAQGYNHARTYLTHVLLLSLVAGYGLAQLWASDHRFGRGIAVTCLLWVAVLPCCFWQNLRERHLETAEHDFFTAALAALPAGVNRIIVPDDDVLARMTHSTIELVNKYRMIAQAAGSGIELLGASRYVEHPEEIDCGRGNCLFFHGVPCMGLRYYWFAQDGCAQLMAKRSGPPWREEEVVGGSFLDCSIYRGTMRRQLCEAARHTQHFGLYPIGS